ncbi:hypothetical protein B0H03_103362 [Rathayibacter iranicus NCPPB 2253 = VKM Ac-1602]|uniref:Uncharacterized protein n=1 Tax=Rathayibacter iranicus NCPPB 2253 = VKM Ac-1602 TaxID=1328868 RepID=A0ABX5LEM0_9MICO|nr:hypothetical protein B0H03_103362 [Rathayibacter iranicus NCPPB 2253 = VKM Ac-1602]
MNKKTKNLPAGAPLLWGLRPWVFAAVIGFGIVLGGVLTALFNLSFPWSLVVEASATCLVLVVGVAVSRRKNR